MISVRIGLQLLLTGQVLHRPRVAIDTHLPASASGHPVASP